MTKTIISAALTGVLATREQCPAIPYTPMEIGEEARRAAEAGAAIVHIHARTPEGAADWSLETFDEIFTEVRARTDVIINFSTGAIGIAPEQRIAHIRDLRPEMAALNMGSMNYAIYSEKRKVFYHDHVFANPFHDIQFFLEAMNGAGVRPEMECFDAGHIGNTRPLIDMGVLSPPFQFSLIMGVLGGIPGTTRHLVDQVDSLPAGSHWQVIGIGLNQWPLVAAAITIGGNVWKITAKPGDKVAEDDVLLILESMKMEISVMAPRAGMVREIRVKEAEVVKEGQVLVVLE